MKNLEGKPFALIGVNVIGHEPARLKTVMDKEDLSWRSFADQGAIVGQWNLSGTPTLYVIDHQGVIRHKWVGNPGERALDSVLQKWIQRAEADTRK